MPFGPFESGINQNTLNDFGNTVVQMGQANGAKAVLNVFMPYTIPQQVTHPFEYQFTPQLMDILTTAPTMAHAVGPRGSNDPAVKGAILPDAVGMCVNTDTFSQVYTFVLVIDSDQSALQYGSGPKVRQIAIGYMTDEPVDQFGNPNPHCVMIFTHSNVMFTKRYFGNDSVDGLHMYPVVNDEYANENTGMFYKEPVFLGTPKELVDTAERMKTNPSAPIEYSDMSLKNVKSGSKCKHVTDEIRSPKAQLCAIAESIDTGLDAVVAGSPISANDSTRYSEGGNLMDTAKQNISYGLPSSEAIEFTHGGLDTSKPMSMVDFNGKYPNAVLNRYTINQSNGYGWDVAPQAVYGMSGVMQPVVSIRNQMSYLACTVIQSICNTLGIADVAFSYCCKPESPFTKAMVHGFQIEKFNPILPRGPQAVAAHAAMMKERLDDQLFDLIFSIAGPFEIHVVADMSGNILVNLILFDHIDGTEGGFFQTSARLGILTNPMLGDIQTINSNVIQLNKLTESLAATHLANLNNQSLFTGLI